jgi:hypothetical protein
MWGAALPSEPTMQFTGRGKVVGPVGRAFDAFIADRWPAFEAFYAASNINESVSAAFEGILYQHFVVETTSSSDLVARRMMRQTGGHEVYLR